MNYHYAGENRQPVGPFTAEQMREFYRMCRCFCQKPRMTEQWAT